MEAGITNFERATWIQKERVTAGDTIDVTFVLKTCPMLRAKFEAKFWAVSDPFGKEYKKYLSLEAIADMLHPVKGEAAEDQLVMEFLAAQPGLLASNETSTSTTTRDLVNAKLDALAAEKFFETELYHYGPKSVGSRKLDFIRASAPYSLPEEVAGKVELVEKLLQLPHLSPAKMGDPTPSPSLAKSAASGADTDPFDEGCAGAGLTCHGSTNPLVLQQAYGFTQLTSHAANNSMACTEFQLQGIKTTDLDNFKSACNVPQVQIDTVVGLGGEALAGVEALLDVEYIEAVAEPIPLTVINSISYSIFDWASSLNSDPTAAWVQSVSYGNDEIQQTSDEYMYSCNTQFMMNGARGISVLFASGDQGVWGRTGHTANQEFHPDFPADSPYVTAVGGTQFTVTGSVGSETTWADGGGGFSNVFPTADFQATAVAAYLASGVALPDAGQFNASGRAYPDVSALAGVANGYCVAAKGQFLKVGGTSAATPVFAGAVAMLNDALLSSGQEPMGYLNPWIYGVAGPAGVFNDVTTGTNNANAGNGFTATTGWDPATGFGTPNFPAMLSLVMGN